jgi:predicted dehydrogenase
MPPFRIGLVGCGRVAAARHLPAIQSLANARVVALADQDAERLRRAGDRFGITARFVSLSEMLAQAAVDVVALCLPAEALAASACEALEGGAHVFVEKPMASSLAEARAVVSCARDGRGRATVGFNLRCHPIAARARAAIRDGRLGRVSAVQMVLGRSGSEPARSGHQAVTLYHAVHGFDLCCFLLQSTIAGVTALASSRASGDHALSVAMRLADGAVATMLVVEHTAPRAEIEILGDRGRLTLDLHRFDGWHLQGVDEHAGDARVRARSIAQTVGQFGAALGRGRGRGDLDGTYLTAWREFLDAIDANQAPPITIEDGWHALAAASAAIESIDHGRAVVVAPCPASRDRRPAPRQGDE